MYSPAIIRNMKVSTRTSDSVEREENKNERNRTSASVASFVNFSCDCLSNNMFRYKPNFHLKTAVIVFLLLTFLDCLHCKPGQDIDAQAVNYLAQFGYISAGEIEKESQNLMSSADLAEPIKNLQRMGNIPVTGRINRRTLELMKKPRCGVKDPVIKGRRSKRYVIAPTKWDKKHLTYRILNYTPDLPIDKARRAIIDAFRVWSDVTELTFTESRNGNADIFIRFASGYHKDGYPFDGKGLILAHAFFPGEDKGGDTHFDEDEHWTFNSTEDGVDLFMVAAHEFGHALGLSHSNEPGALMYPWYQGYTPNFRLPYDDTLGIQRIYGGKGGLPRDPPPRPDPKKPVTRVTSRPPVRRPEKPSPCDAKFDAIAVIRSEIFLFSGKYFWRSLDPTSLANSEPTDIHSFWYNFPQSIDHIDAVYENPNDNKIVFFVGDKYWKYDGNHQVAGQPEDGRPITDFGIPPDIKRIDAVYVWGFNKRTYLVSGDMYWKLQENTDFIEPDYPRDMSIWENVPVPLDAAFQHWNQKTYFFKDDNIYEFYDMKMKVKDSYPKPIRERFLGCAPTVKSQSITQEELNNGASAIFGNVVTLTLSAIFIFKYVCL